MRQTRQLSAARQFSLRGADALQQEKWEDAEALFGEALRRSPADERAQWGMAEIMWRQGQSEAATEHMRLAAQISGDNPDLLVRLGEMYLEAGDIERALAHADLALQGQRDNPSAWALRGQALYRRDQLQEAMHCYHRALIGQPNLPKVQIALARIYQQLGRPQRALATLDRLADATNTSELPAQAWMLKGQALADLGELDEAQGCLKSAALCADDQQTDLLLELARTQFQAGELAEARICLGRALRNNPHSPQALAMQSDFDQRFGTATDLPIVPIRQAGFAKEKTNRK